MALSTDISIRTIEPADWAVIWPMLDATFTAGDTYAFAPDSSEAEIHRAWVELPTATFVACDSDGQILGTYYIKPNQPGLGGHVCNCGYVVSPAAQGQGIASALCRHSQMQAKALGFRAMQFNLVASSNERAIQLWQRLGYAEIGRLPGAFRHTRLGYIDALIMFKTLID